MRVGGWAWFAGLFAVVVATDAYVAIAGRARFWVWHDEHAWRARGRMRILGGMV